VSLPVQRLRPAVDYSDRT